MLSFKDFLSQTELQELQVISPQSWNYTTNNPPRLLTDKPVKPKKAMRLLKAVGGGEIRKGVYTPNRTMGIDRSKMPQLKNREEFIQWLQTLEPPLGPIQVFKVMKTPRSLVKFNGEKLTAHMQSQIYLQKAMNFIRKNTLLHKLIILTRDGKIFDGNHHWLALRAVAPDTPVPMYQVNMDAEPLLQLTTQHFPGVTFEQHWIEDLGCFVEELTFNGEML